MVACDHAARELPRVNKNSTELIGEAGNERAS